MGHSRTPTQNTAGEGLPADPIGSWAAPRLSGMISIALFASCVVRPHVIHADGSLRLRYGALLDIRIPAQEITAACVERRSARGKLAAVDADGCAALSQGGQTTVTVQMARPVAFTRPLGKPACARTVCFYAAGPAAAVAAIRARVPALQTTP